MNQINLTCCGEGQKDRHDHHCEDGPLPDSEPDKGGY